VTTQEFYQPGFMDLTAYELRTGPEGADWDDLIARSDQGSIFSLSPYLENLYNAQPRTLCCFKGGELKAALVVMESPNGKSCIYEDFVIHTGIMLLPPVGHQSTAQTTAENFRVTSFIVSELTRRYDDVFVSTHPHFPDIRPFLWHNYGSEDTKFEVDIRYTSMLKLNGIVPERPINENPIYLSSSKSRRQEIRYGLQKGVKTICESDVGRFLELYRSTFDRQRQLLDDRQFQRLRRLVEALLSAGLARMYLSWSGSGDLGSIAVFGIDSKRAYYLFGANDPDLRNQHTGTMVIWDALQDLASLGVREVDLEGVNSPQRGHFKLSFGGTLTSYYHLNLRKAS
jgi:hypothetical protein